MYRQYSFLLIFVLFTISYGCSSSKILRSNTDRTERKMILRDEGLSQLAYVDIATSSNNWYVPVPAGRDLQLIGNGRVLIGTGTGYEERSISTGQKLHEVNMFAGTIAARRLLNGNTLLTGLNWQGKKGIVLIELNKNKNNAIQHVINYPTFNYVRLVRQTATGTFLVTADDIVFEGKEDGTIIWQAKVAAKVKPHAWQALRLANGQTIVSTGYGANFQIFDKDGKVVDSISGPASVKPSFFSGFQILSNGNFLVSNWQGHGPNFGATGVQILEYTPSGDLAWSWQQDASKFSSIQGVIVLDGLNTNHLHVEDKNGKLVPVK